MTRLVREKYPTRPDLSRADPQSHDITRINCAPKFQAISRLTLNFIGQHCPRALGDDHNDTE